MAKTETKVVSVIQKDGDKSYFKRCGIAFVNRDGSLNVKLDLFPEVTLHIGDKYDPSKRQSGDEDEP